MRKLVFGDVPAFCRVLKRCGLSKDQVREIALNSDTLKDAWSKGFEIFWAVFDCASEPAGENAIYEFLSGPFEMTPEDVRSMELTSLVNSLKMLAKENNLTDFFKSAAALMKLS